MAALLIGYARCFTDQQDLTAQRDGLLALGLDPARICSSRLASTAPPSSPTSSAWVARRSTEPSNAARQREPEA
jgi:hypothetical protein